VTAARTGPFWDGVEGRAPMPKAAATLGLEVLAVDGDRGTVELAFTARDEWTNPAGNVLGAFVAAMLYDTVGPALLATVAPDEFQSTLQLSVTFLRPVRPGRLFARGWVVHRHDEVVALEATLLDGDSSALATATATALVIPLGSAPAAV
jgi:uncharacterized protein (TIGR00369 family)